MTLESTMTQSNELNGSIKYVLNPSAICFINISVIKITVNKMFTLSNLLFKAVSSGYLSRDRRTVLTMIESEMNPEKMLLFDSL